MSILTIIFILAIAWAVINLVTYYARKDLKEVIRKRITHVRSLGLLALITGILGQLIGLYMAFVAIEQAADISPAIIFGGLKVSMITTLYGLSIYLIALIIWIVSDVVIIGGKS